MSGLSQLFGVSEQQLATLGSHAATLVRLGRTDAARDAFQVLTDLDPLNGEHWLAWAELERRAGETERAEGLEEVASWFA